MDYFNDVLAMFLSLDPVRILAVYSFQSRDRLEDLEGKTFIEL